MFEVHYSNKANKDLDNLLQVIIANYKAPITAYRYTQGVINTIRSTAKAPEAYPVQTSQSLQQYGQNVRRVNYKKMAIIYTVHNNIVYVHRIIPSAIIID